MESKKIQSPSIPSLTEHVPPQPAGTGMPESVTNSSISWKDLLSQPPIAGQRVPSISRDRLRRSQTIVFPWGVNSLAAPNPRTDTGASTPGRSSTAISRRQRNLSMNSFVVEQVEIEPEQSSIFDQSQDYVETGFSVENLFYNMVDYLSKLLDGGQHTPDARPPDIIKYTLPSGSPPPIPPLPDPIPRNFPK